MGTVSLAVKQVFMDVSLVSKTGHSESNLEYITAKTVLQFEWKYKWKDSKRRITNVLRLSKSGILTVVEKI